MEVIDNTNIVGADSISIQENEKTEDNQIKQKNKFTIFGISIWRICAYFIIYSFIGFIIETVFGLVTKGVIESRRSSLYMPICSIYGAGAIVMILRVTTFQKK